MRFLITFVLLFSAAAAVFAQTAERSAAALPAEPQPSPAAAPLLPDAEWARIQALPRGQWLLVSTNFRPPVRCRFDGATNAILFCNPSGWADDTGFQFERLSVTSIDIVSAPRQAANWHPAWLSGIIAGGVVVGFVASGETDAGSAARDGLIGAICVAGITAPMAFLPHDGMSFAPRPYGFQAGVRVPLRAPRLHRVFRR